MSIANFQNIVVDVMRHDSKKKSALMEAMKWCRKRCSAFRTDERRKVGCVMDYYPAESYFDIVLCMFIKINRIIIHLITDLWD